MTPMLDPAREWLADQIRARVIGNEPRLTPELLAAPGPRWFADDSPIRVVHADAAMFIGGLRALLLQSLHPLAMAGVAGHSDFRTDPWGRLQRTAEFLAATTFAPADVAERAIAAVRTVHERVVGFAADGRPYAANDPHLLRWVHVVEVDSFLAAHQRYGSRRLSPAEADRYVHDAAVIARKLGSEEPPTTVARAAPAARCVPPGAARHPRGARRSPVPRVRPTVADRRQARVRAARVGRRRAAADVDAVAAPAAAAAGQRGAPRAARRRRDHAG